MAIPASSAAKHARSHFLARILSPCTIDIATAIATRHRGTRPFRRNRTLANALSEATQIRRGDGKEKKSKPCTCAPCSIAKTFHATPGERQSAVRNHHFKSFFLDSRQTPPQSSSAAARTKHSNLNSAATPTSAHPRIDRPRLTAFSPIATSSAAIGSA